MQATLTVDSVTGAGTVTVTGAFSGSGTVETLKRKRAGRTRHFVEKLTFGSDSVNVKAVAVHKSRQLEASTCTVTETRNARWIITKGTGAFGKVKGAGHLVATATVTGSFARADAVIELRLARLPRSVRPRLVVGSDTFVVVAS